MNLSDMARALDESGEYRVLRRLVPREPSLVMAPIGTEVKHGIIIDLETTGLDPAKDEVIEIAMVPFAFTPSDGRIVEVMAPFTALRQPSVPIPAEITEITGIDAAMVEGHAIDLEALAALVAPADVVIAHHAEFDRPFAEKLCEAFVRKCWACSMSQINWRGEGLQSRSLAALLMDLGFFYERHRALSDAQALAALLDSPLPKSDTPALLALLDAARRTSWQVWAIDSPFPKKDVLKGRGYRWNSGEDGRPKSWWIAVENTEKRDAELAWLRTDIYRDDRKLLVEPVTAFDRFGLRQISGMIL